MYIKKSEISKKFLRYKMNDTNKNISKLQYLSKLVQANPIGEL